MDQATVLDFTVKAMTMVLFLSMPPIIVATVVGIGVSLLQALTQIQEQTLSFAVKLIVVTATLLFTASWMGSEMLQFSVYIFEGFPAWVAK
jgi:type III secretion HrpO family protein